MLKKITIRNFALIEHVEIDFSNGFSVITGETGHGKSVFLGALSMLLGQRSDAKAVREGADRCIVEGCFDISGFNLEGFFNENDLDYDTECIIRREVALLSGLEIDIVENDDDEDVYDLYVNGEYIEEDFLGEPMMTEGDIEYPFEVPENSFFVMGDNRNESLDSRRESVGAIHKDDLMGKVVLRLYPFSEFGLID